MYLYLVMVCIFSLLLISINLYRSIDERKKSILGSILNTLKNLFVLDRGNLKISHNKDDKTNISSNKKRNTVSQSNNPNFENSFFDRENAVKGYPYNICIKDGNVIFENFETRELSQLDSLYISDILIYNYNELKCAKKSNGTANMNTDEYYLSIVLEKNRVLKNGHREIGTYFYKSEYKKALNLKKYFHRRKTELRKQNQSELIYMLTIRMSQMQQDEELRAIEYKKKIEAQRLNRKIQRKEFIKNLPLQKELKRKKMLEERARIQKEKELRKQIFEQRCKLIFVLKNVVSEKQNELTLLLKNAIFQEQFELFMSIKRKFWKMQKAEELLLSKLIREEELRAIEYKKKIEAQRLNRKIQRKEFIKNLPLQKEMKHKKMIEERDRIQKEKEHRKYLKEREKEQLEQEYKKKSISAYNELEQKLKEKEREFEEYKSNLDLKKQDYQEKLLNYEQLFMDSSYYLTINPFDFEEHVAEFLKFIGYDDAKATQKTGDFGVDVVAKRDGVLYAIQVKRYAPNNPTPEKAVQEVLSGKAYANAHVGMVITTSYFTQKALQLAEQTGVILWDRDKLKEKIYQLK